MPAINEASLAAFDALTLCVLTSALLDYKDEDGLDDLLDDLDDLDDFERELLEDQSLGDTELLAISWVHVAATLCDGVPRGSYDQIPKSKDFFATALQAPDRWFRQMFRYALSFIFMLILPVNSHSE